MTSPRIRDVRLLHCTRHKIDFIGRCPECLKAIQEDVRILRAGSRGGRPRKQKTYGGLATVRDTAR